LNKGIMPKLIL